MPCEACLVPRCLHHMHSLLRRPPDAVVPSNASNTSAPSPPQAYMLVDLFCFLLPFTPNDFLFVGHHIMTATYMTSSVVRHLSA